MNTNLRRNLLVLIISVVPTALTFAGSPPLKPREPYKPTYDYVEAVDPTAQTVTIGHKNSTNTATKVFKLDKFTEIEVNGEKGSLADIKAGMKASVTPGMDDGTASRLVVSPAPPEPTPFPKKPKPPGY